MGDGDRLVLSLPLRRGVVISCVLLVNLLVNVVLGNVDPGGDDWHVLSVLLRLVNLFNLVNPVGDPVLDAGVGGQRVLGALLLISLLTLVGLGNPLVNFVLDTSLVLHFASDLTSECITK